MRTYTIIKIFLLRFLRLHRRIESYASAVRDFTHLFGAVSPYGLWLFLCTATHKMRMGNYTVVRDSLGRIFTRENLLPKYLQTKERKKKHLFQIIMPHVTLQSTYVLKRCPEVPPLGQQKINNCPSAYSKGLFEIPQFEPQMHMANIL